MNANHPFYIDHHPCELSLDGEWRFTYIDTVSDEPWTLSYPYTAVLPASTYRCLERAGILPDPYFGTNSKLYEWVDKKCGISPVALHWIIPMVRMFISVSMESVTSVAFG